MERVTQNSKGNVPFFQQAQQPPEIGVQDGIAASDVEIGQAVIHLAHVTAVVYNVLHLFPGHGVQLFAVVLRENIAMLAPLIAFGNPPGKGLPCRGTAQSYLSPAPQAEPQAAGFSSGLSAAPQAEPHAAGFSSGLSAAPQAAGLSDAPQEEPAQPDRYFRTVSNFPILFSFFLPDSQTLPASLPL